MSPEVLDKLRALVGAPHVLTGVELSPYVVEGRTPDAAVFPGSVDEIRGVVALASETSVPVRPWGGGSACAVGTPPSHPGIVLALSRLDRVLEHEPGDLTATAQAGVVIGRFQAALASRGQWLSLDPPDGDRATLGGVTAADASGPRRQLYGTMRDQLIGIAVVTADGALVRGGAKVVKSVAGYDLPKLFIGSYGTLGIIVEVTVRLRPRPEAERWLAVTFDRLKDAGAAARAVMASDLIPAALDVLDGEAARACRLGGEGAVLVVAFDGVAEQVEWECREVRSLLAPLGARTVVPLPDDAYAAAARSGVPAACMRLAVLPTAVTDVMEHGASAARQRGLASAWTAHAGAGVVTGRLDSPGDGADLDALIATLNEWREMARRGGGHATLEWAPLAIKAAVPVWGDMGAAGRLMQRIKSQLDPRNVLNPGRFVAGI